MAEALAFAKTFQKKRGIFGELKKRLYRDIIEILDAREASMLSETSSLTMSD